MPCHHVIPLVLESLVSFSSFHLSVLLWLPVALFPGFIVILSGEEGKMSLLNLVWMGCVTVYFNL